MVEARNRGDDSEMSHDLKKLWALLVQLGIHDRRFCDMDEPEIKALCMAVSRAGNEGRLQEIDGHLARIRDNPAQLPSVESCQVRALNRFKEELAIVPVVLRCEE